jgi:hypothetical protein
MGQPHRLLAASEVGEVNLMGNDAGNHETKPEELLEDVRAAEESEEPGPSVPPERDQPRNLAGDKPIDSRDRPIGDKPAHPTDTYN